MDTMNHESEINNKYYFVHVAKAVVFLSHDNPWAQRIDDKAYEHVRKEFVKKSFM